MRPDGRAKATVDRTDIRGRAPLRRVAGRGPKGAHPTFNGLVVVKTADAGDLGENRTASLPTCDCVPSGSVAGFSCALAIKTGSNWSAKSSLPMGAIAVPALGGFMAGIRSGTNWRMTV